jgi:hypothetical protein
LEAPSNTTGEHTRIARSLDVHGTIAHHGGGITQLARVSDKG